VQTPVSLRLAGAVLVFLSLVMFYERAAFPGLFTKGLLANAWMASVIDLGIGVALLAGERRVVGWALARVLIGGLVFGGSMAMEANWVGVGQQLALSLGVALLLLADTALPLLALGLTACMLALSVELVGITGLRTGTYPLLALMNTYKADPIPGDVLEGRKGSYVLALPAGDRWKLRRADAVAKDNPRVDRWLALPRHDSHLLVLVEELPTAQPRRRAPAQRPVEQALREVPPADPNDPESELDRMARVSEALERQRASPFSPEEEEEEEAPLQLDLEKVAAAVAAEMQKAHPALQLEEWTDVEARAFTGLRTSGVATVEGQQLSFRVLVAHTPGKLYQLVAFAPVVALPQVEEDLEALLAGFTPG
jgi:hypothetical protein